MGQDYRMRTGFSLRSEEWNRIAGLGQDSRIKARGQIRVQKGSDEK